MQLEFNRTIDVMDEFDVLVCGGGTAGFGAAVQAARLGLKTALIEQYGMLGGVLTTGGNTEIALFYAEGVQIIAGIAWEYVKRMEKMGWASIPDFKPGRHHSELGVKVNGPMAAYTMDAMCSEAGVRLYFHQRIVDVITVQKGNEKKVSGVVLATKEGLKALNGKIVIDCSGDGDIAAFSGAAYELGDAHTGALQPGTLRFYYSGYEDKQISRTQVEEAYDRARGNGQLLPGDFWPEPNGHPMEIFNAKGNNINHVHPVNGASSESRTAAEIEGRKSVARMVHWARESVKGAENAEPIACGAEVAIRESRRIIGEKYITFKEYLEAVVYADAICSVYYPVDLHTGERESLKNIYLEKGKVPSIPFGALVPKGFSNLMVAGRCISGDRLAISAVRMKAFCMAMGQAAGVAAYLAIKDNLKVRDIDTEVLREMLRDMGTIVP